MHERITEYCLAQELKKPFNLSLQKAANGIIKWYFIQYELFWEIL
jgi:hypothetical protein